MTKPMRNVSTDYNILFMHIPKNAGCSVLRLDIFVNSWAHHTLSEYKSRVAPDLWSNLTTVAIVRNPWDRFTSLWGYFNSMGQGHDFYQETNIPISKWIKSRGSFREVVLQFNKAPFAATDMHFFSQTYWFGDLEVDRILRYETLADDWEKLATQVGMPVELRSLPHVNKSEHLPYREIYDDETREIIGSIYNEDVTRFGYSF